MIQTILAGDGLGSRGSIFAKPFAKQIGVFAEPIRLIIGFAKKVF